MQYYALKSSHALQTLEDLRNDKQINLRQVVEIRGHGDDLKALKDVLRDLKNKLNEIRSKYPLILRPHDPSGGKFESEACSIVHSTLPPDPCMLGDYEWWTWLAIVRFRDLVEWRYGPSKPTAPANFGIGSGSENLLYRMWLRADIGYDPKRKDPYELARRGDQDFWRSHVFRQSYGRCRTLVRALILYQFPDGSGNNRPTLKNDEIRELAKRLRLLHANMVFECLDQNSAYELISQEAERVKAEMK